MVEYYIRMLSRLTQRMVPIPILPIRAGDGGRFFSERGNGAGNRNGLQLLAGKYHCQGYNSRHAFN
jgi:hypothetical protein